MQLQTFKNNEFNLEALINKDKNIYFKGKDVATALGYQNTNQAIIKHVDEEDKITQEELLQGSIKTIPPSQQLQGGIETTPPLNENDKKTIFINEAGFYSLVLSSKLATAKKFKKWVVSEVLPEIRKTGGYNLHPEKYPKSIAFKIENEYDLHVKTVQFIRRFYPSAIINAGLGELQDTSDKRIKSWKKGYTKGQPDIIIQNFHKKYTGFAIEFKTPLGCGRTSEAQENLLEKYSENGFKILVSNDYDLILQEINNYMKDVRIKCCFCNRGFRNKNTLRNHKKYFHRIIL